MSDVLVRIKRTVLAGRYAFSENARTEMEASGLTELDVVESIASAVREYTTEKQCVERNQNDVSDPISIERLGNSG